MAVSPPDPDHHRLKQSATLGSATDSRPAEWLSLPRNRIVTVEHPCIVKDFDNGLKSLGGENHVKNLLAPAGQTISVGLSLRPHDPIAKRLVSREVTVQNVLLRVSVPKRTGRKRKRGSDEPFAFQQDSTIPLNGDTQVNNDPQPLNASALVGRLRDNPTNYTIEPVGSIKESHRFRALPDFQIKTGDQTVMKEIVQHLTTASLDSIKRFNIDTRPGVKPGEQIVPPPSFTSFEQSMNYGYRQNPGVSAVLDEQGHVKTVNLQRPKKRAVRAFHADIETVPAGPPPDLVPLDQSNVYLKQAVKNIANLLEERPVVTRRVAMNLIDWGSESLFKEATQYVGYSFKSGPWRDALVKYGVDPRTDRKYRVYQTLSFQLMSKDKVIAAAKKMPDGKNTWIRSERYKKDEQPSHIFDGKGITTNGKTWQICDIREPMIKGLLDTEDLRTECDVDTFGWYQNGTMAKVRIIMRDMIGMMLLGQMPDYSAYEKLATIPNIIDPSNYPGCYFEREQHGEKVMALSGDIRNLAKTTLVMKDKKLALAAQNGRDAGGAQVAMGNNSSGGRWSKVASGAMGGAVEDAEDEEMEEEVEGDDLNASDDDAEEGADMMDEED